MVDEMEIDIKLLKEFALEKLVSYPFTRNLILEEPSSIKAEEFLIKMEVWLKLLEKEIENNKLV
jgi:hypothetical protein